MLFYSFILYKHSLICVPGVFIIQAVPWSLYYVFLWRVHLQLIKKNLDFQNWSWWTEVLVNIRSTELPMTAWFFVHFHCTGLLTAFLHRVALLDVLAGACRVMAAPVCVFHAVQLTAQSLQWGMDAAVHVNGTRAINGHCLILVVLWKGIICRIKCGVVVWVFIKVILYSSGRSRRTRRAWKTRFSMRALNRAGNEEISLKLMVCSLASPVCVITLASHLWSDISRAASRSRRPTGSRSTHLTFFTCRSNRSRRSLIVMNKDISVNIYHSFWTPFHFWSNIRMLL